MAAASSSDPLAGVHARQEELEREYEQTEKKRKRATNKQEEEALDLKVPPCTFGCVLACCLTCRLLLVRR